MPRTAKVSIALSMLLACHAFAASDRSAAPAWLHSPDAAFDAARRTQRFVILDLEAVWCHWCHVMDQQTYADAAVRKELAEHYVALKLDQDANPDFAARYGDWGWPATIVFAADGSEIVKRRGFIEPKNMLSMLQAIVADPSPGPSVGVTETVIAAKDATLSAATRERLLDDFNKFYNTKNAGWGDGQRFVDAPSVELAMELARAGDEHAQLMAKQTLDANLALIDPVWGGVYQYSVGPGWGEPHYEKIMAYQADDLRLYALAYATWPDPEYREAARSIEHYLTTFLRAPDGAFYVSQDADLSASVDGHAYYAKDDAARRKLGIPHVDMHRYTRENAWAITALCQAYDSLADADALASATRAARWVLAHRARKDGGFNHDERDNAGPYLADNVAMAQALLALYRSTADRQWLTAATRALDFIDTQFRAGDAGFVTAHAAKGARGALATPIRIADENVALARVANLMFHVSGNDRYRAIAEHAARFVAAPASVDSGRFMPGVLLVDRELSRDPVHIAIVGAKDDAAAQTLHVAALRYPALYRRIDWWDRREGPLPNPQVTYPTMKRAAAFICTGNACSSPVFDAKAIAVAADRLIRDANSSSDASARAPQMPRRDNAANDSLIR